MLGSAPALHMGVAQVEDRQIDRQSRRQEAVPCCLLLPEQVPPPFDMLVGRLGGRHEIQPAPQCSPNYDRRDDCTREHGIQSFHVKERHHFEGR